MGMTAMENDAAVHTSPAYGSIQFSFSLETGHRLSSVINAMALAFITNCPVVCQALTKSVSYLHSCGREIHSGRIFFTAII
jgi:hypothetical protein